jgi:aspartate aminotransferase
MNKSLFRITNIGISQTLRINELCNKLSLNNREVFNFGFGQSPFKPPKFFQDKIIENMDKNGYMSVAGLPDLRNSISNHYKKFHIIDNKISQNNIVIGPGSKELLCLLNLSIDEDIYFIAPYWVSYVNQLKIFNKKFKITNTTYEQKWKITPEQIKLHTNNSFLLINFPNNPTGLTYSIEELQNIVDVCRDKNITIISDEIYQYLNFSGKPNTLLELYPENTIVSNGLSKWCHSGGYRLGYMVINIYIFEFY